MFPPPPRSPVRKMEVAVQARIPLSTRPRSAFKTVETPLPWIRYHGEAGAGGLEMQATSTATSEQIVCRQEDLPRFQVFAVDDVILCRTPVVIGRPANPSSTSLCQGSLYAVGQIGLAQQRKVTIFERQASLIVSSRKNNWDFPAFEYLSHRLDSLACDIHVQDRSIDRLGFGNDNGCSDTRSRHHCTAELLQNVLQHHHQQHFIFNHQDASPGKHLGLLSGSHPQSPSGIESGTVMKQRTPTGSKS